MSNRYLVEHSENTVQDRVTIESSANRQIRTT